MMGIINHDHSFTTSQPFSRRWIFEIQAIKIDGGLKPTKLNLLHILMYKYNIQFIRNTLGSLEGEARGETDKHAFTLPYEFIPFRTFAKNIQQIEFGGQGK
jgi:hypothetical protein